MSLIGLLLAVLVLCVVIWGVRALLGAFSIQDPIRTVVIVIVALICLVWFLGFVGAPGFGGMRFH